MINPSPTLTRFEARYDREAWRGDTFEAALRRFAALWNHARLVNPELGADWADDLAADRAIARAVNGLPPGA
ncbi:MAG TPA: hypothetical protein VGA42_09710 [Gemmatimonadales bacterium]